MINAYGTLPFKFPSLENSCPPWLLMYSSNCPIKSCVIRFNSFWHMFHCSNNWWQAASRRIFSRFEVLESPSLCIDASNVDIGMGNVKPTRCNNCDVPSWMDWSGFITYLFIKKMKIVVWLFNGLFNGLLFNGCSMELSKRMNVRMSTQK